MTIHETVTDFLTEQQIRGNSPLTLEYYKNALNDFLNYLNTISDLFPLENLNVPVCKGFYLYLANKNLSSVSIQSKIRGIRAYLTYLYDSEYININITQKFKLPKAQRKTINILTYSEVEKLFSVFNTSSYIDLRNLCIIALMIDSGLRLTEVSNLKICNVHLQEHYIIVLGKGNKERVVPIGAICYQYLSLYILRNIYNGEISSLLFEADGKTPLSRNAVKLMFQKLKLRSDIPRIHPHLLRHTFATRYLENGGNIYDLQKILGHTSLEMCKKYLHISSAHIVDTFNSFSPLDVMKKTIKINP